MSRAEQAEATIAAIATPPGQGGIGIVRISGKAAPEVLKRLFRPRRPHPELVSHRVYYGWIVDPESGVETDEVLAILMRAPHTYTREDVVEIHAHGSFLSLQNILSLVLAAGVRLAEPGEFTKRAFVNGRIDLTQAEAVLDLIEAKTATGLSMAMAQLKGGLHAEINAVREALISARAIVEVAIDFPDDDVEILNPLELLTPLRRDVEEPLLRLLAAAERGKIFRDGISVVILGRPNVGKSSLLNTLLREDRAIVTPVPGTTRDVIEEYLNIKGLPVRLVDTAGIRRPSEAAEELGIKKAQEKLKAADLVLLMYDASEPLTEEDRALAKSAAEKPLILVLNKIDLVDRVEKDVFAALAPGRPVVLISAKEQLGIDALEDAIFKLATGGAQLSEPPSPYAPNVRHRAALGKALTAVQAAIEGLARGLTPDLLAIDLQSALEHLEEIGGETTNDDILDRIFSRFCLGK